MKTPWGAAQVAQPTVAPYCIHQSRTHEYMGGRRQLRKAEPSDVVVLLGSDVRWRSLPVTHKPRAQECRLFCRSGGQPTQVRRRARPNHHAELLVQLTGERAQFGLASLDDSTRQIPHARVGTLVRT